MTKLTWDGTGQRKFENGVDHGVLYLPTAGVYDQGVPWNGLVSVTESPSGGEATPFYADNLKYLNIRSKESFGATVEAFTYPSEFEECDGSAVPSPGVRVTQQERKPFGMCYRTLIGTDEEPSAGYRLHLVYGATASPSEKAYSTVNDTPEIITFSWEITTVEVAVTDLKPTALITIDSTEVGASGLSALEDALYGTAGTEAYLPLPDEVIAFFAGEPQSVTPGVPTYDAPSHTITIPGTSNVVYRRTDTNAVVGAGPLALTAGQRVVIKATPAAGYKFPANTDDDWQFSY